MNRFEKMLNKKYITCKLIGPGGNGGYNNFGLGNQINATAKSMQKKQSYCYLPDRKIKNLVVTLIIFLTK